MRILMTTDTVGGVWTFTSTLTHQLLGRGHAVHLVSFGRKPSADQVAEQDTLTKAYPSLFGFTNSDLPLEWMQNNETVQADGAALLESVLQNEDGMDVILSSQFCFGRLQSPVPRIVVAHSDVLSWAAACKPSALEPSPWLNRYTAMVQAGLLDAAAVVAPTSFMGTALRSNFFLPKQAFVLPNGVQAEPAGDDAPQRRLQAISAGRLWDEAKGLDILKDLDTAMPLLIAGENTFETVGTDVWPAHLQILGPLSRPALHRHFRQSATYLCTSRYEPFGLAPLEAALCGCAVVTRDLPGLREVWADSALYFQDPSSLQAILQQLMGSPDLLTQAQARAFARASLFTPQRMADNYLQLFSSVLQRQGATPHAA